MQNLQQVQHSEGLTQFELSKQLVRSGFFSKVKLQPSSRLVLGALVSHYPNIRPSIETIAIEAGCNTRTVERCLSELKKAGLIFITYTGRANHYKLTPLFFSQISMPEQTRQYEQIPPTICHPNKKEEKKNKDFKKIDFPKERTLPKYYHDTHITGVNYPKWKPPEQKKESPLDLDKEQAIEFLNNLPCRMQNSYFATELRKKWGINKD